MKTILSPSSWILWLRHLFTSFDASFTSPTETLTTYATCGTLLTPAERSFLNALAQVSGPTAHISCKVRLADVIKPRMLGPEWLTATHKINQTHLDFVVCEQGTMKIICCVELHDTIHQRPNRNQQDGFVRQALASAGVAFLEYEARRGYSLSDLRAALLAVIDPSAQATPQRSTPPQWRQVKVA